MQSRAGWSVMLAVVVLLSALTGTVAAVDPEPASAQPLDTATAQADAESQQLCEGGPPDPETDVLGWEAGCWHNESIGVTQFDGLNDSEVNAVVARTMARVERVRQLEFKRTVPVEIQTREEYKARRANHTTSATLRTFDNAKFEALFLIGEQNDSIVVQNKNAGVSILGFYSPAREAIVLISEQESQLEIEETTLAHELVHALQDQHFNLSRYDARTRDAVNAENGLIEGDASLVEFRYNQRCQGAGAWGDTCLSQTDVEGGGGLANIGPYLVKFQPYSDGPSFIQALYNQGGWAAVNAAYENPPTTTEQILHPEAYPSEQATNVSLADRNTDNWDRVRPPNRPDYAEVGEAALTTMLIYPLYDGGEQIISSRDWLNRTPEGELSDFDPLNYENEFTTGWAGDRLHVYVNEANETGYVWRLVWDSPGDATEFIEGYTQVLEYWGAEETEPGLWEIDDGPFADAIHLAVDGDTVTIVNAPTPDQLNEIRSGTVTTPTPTPSPSPTVDQDTPSPVPGTVSSPTPVTTVSPGPTTTPGQPGFGPLVALIGLLTAVLWWRRH